MSENINPPPLSPSHLTSSRIPSLPPSISYIPEFLTPSECAALLDHIPANRWIALSHRRLQAHPSPLSKSDVLLDAPLPAWLATAPVPVLARLGALGVFAGSPHGRPNHCLVNEYRAGEGIMPHEDGAAYSGTVATVSLGDGVVLDVYPKRRRADEGSGSSGGGGGGGAAPVEPLARIFQEPGSLLVTTGAAYTDLLHGIGAVDEDVGLGPDTLANWGMLRDETRSAIEADGGRRRRGTRTSLTYRDVLKVRRIGIGVLGRRA